VLANWCSYLWLVQMIPHLTIMLVLILMMVLVLLIHMDVLTRLQLTTIATVNTSDTSCVWLGCTQSSCNATNSTTFPANAYNIVDDGSCITAVYGCTNPGSLNYNATANVNQVSCTDTTNPCVTSSKWLHD
jgi:hypothetical protein